MACRCIKHSRCQDRFDAAMALVRHVLAMRNDAYLDGHPEWLAIVADADKAIDRISSLPRHKETEI